MKLYSRGQVILFSAASALIVLLLGLGVGLFTPKPAPAVPVEEPETFEYQTSTLPDSEIVPVANGNHVTEDEQNSITIYQKLNQGVVNITTEVLTFNWLAYDPVPQEGGTGSGSIIDGRGFVLTNNHVIEDAINVYITLYDGEQYEGEIVGVDPENDLAVLRFDPDGRDLVTVPFGTSSDLQVGQKVLAIGNPFALERTLTTGIVSGLGRPIQTQNNLIIQDMIQTDASINPGNSGGPLIDSQGKMIGINTMIYSPGGGGSVGIGFAVPVDTALRIVPQLIQFGEVRRGWIDAELVELDYRLVRFGKQNNLIYTDSGLLVSQVNPGSNAAEAGIQGGSQQNAIRYGRNTIIYLGGDVITEVNDLPIESTADLYSALEETKPGQTVKVVVDRRGRRREFSVVLSERPHTGK